MLFQKMQNKLQEIKNMDFKLEKDIQRLLESNLEAVFGLHSLKLNSQSMI